MTIKAQQRNLALMISIASQAHVHQYDRGRKPYILHPLTVMQFVKQAGGDLEQQQIAIGHDLFEDTEVDAAHLSALGISTRVIEGIKCLTKVEGESYEEYKAKVKSNPDAVVVKMADLRHNTDVSRLNKTELSEKDIARIVKYNQFYLELQTLVKTMRSKSLTLIQLSIWGILTACLATLILVGVGVPADLSLFVGCGATLVAMVFAIIETFLNDELNEN